MTHNIIPAHTRVTMHDVYININIYVFIYLYTYDVYKMYIIRNHDQT